MRGIEGDAVVERSVFGIKHSNETTIKSNRKVLKLGCSGDTEQRRASTLRQNAQKSALLGAEFGNIAQKPVEISKKHAFLRVVFVKVL